MADEWLLKASDLEAQLQHAIKRNDELEGFVESVAKLTVDNNGNRIASVRTENLTTLLDSIKQ